MPAETLRITPAPADLARLYPWLDEAAAPLALPKPLLNSMHVALEEAVMNVVMHGFAPEHVQEIFIHFTPEPEKAVIVVEDAGKPFDVTQAAEKARPESLLDAEPGGLGIKLLRHYCKDISYARESGRNRLTLGFPL
jgi:anti-sigma regulatory factor (Ser/Thr protein kinase)